MVTGFVIPAAGALFPAAVSIVASQAPAVALRAVVAGLAAVTRTVGPGADLTVFAEAASGQWKCAVNPQEDMFHICISAQTPVELPCMINYLKIPIGLQKQ